jgi:hypothetical protein
LAQITATYIGMYLPICRYTYVGSKNDHNREFQDKRRYSQRKSAKIAESCDHNIDHQNFFAQSGHTAHQVDVDGVQAGRDGCALSDAVEDVHLESICLMDGLKIYSVR